MRGGAARCLRGVAWTDGVACAGRFGQSKADGAQLRQAQHRLRAGDAADDDTGDDADAAEEADDADAAVDAAADADAAPAAAAALAEAAAAAATAISSVRALELLPLDRALSLLYIDLLPSDREVRARACGLCAPAHVRCGADARLGGGCRRARRRRC